MQCDAWRDSMLDVLYGEADAATVRQVEEHQGQCSSCRQEMAAFRKVRKDLSAWTLAEPRSGRRVAARPWFLRGWAVAAAVLLACCGALALAGAEVRIENGSLALRVGPGTRPDEVRALLAEQEARHRREIEALRASFTNPARDDEAVLRRVAEMIRESEVRQASQADIRLAAYGERAETQRRLDMARISAGLTYLDGKHVARATEMMGYVMQASEKR